MCYLFPVWKCIVLNLFQARRNIYPVIVLSYSSCTVHGLAPLAYSDSELTSETMNPFRRFGRTPWMGNRTITQRKKQKSGHVHTALGILTHDSSVRAILITCALDHMATGLR